MSGRTCSIDACAKSARKGGRLCSMHSNRIHRHGHPDARTFPLETPGYSAIHERIKRAKGRAAGYACVDCGEQAAQWTFCECTPEYAVRPDHGRPRRCTTDLNAYEPRCHRCHGAQRAAMNMVGVAS